MTPEPVIGMVLSNLLYVIVAIGAAVILAVILVLVQRKPKSVEANVASFHKGLRALAPDDEDERPAVRPSWGGAHRPVLVHPDEEDGDGGTGPGAQDLEDQDLDARPEADPSPTATEHGAPETPEIDVDGGRSDDVHLTGGGEEGELDAPVELAARQRQGTRRPAPTDDPSSAEGPFTSEETGTG